MRAGTLNRWVTLSTVPKMGGSLAPLVPPGEWVSIAPLPPGSSDSWTVMHQVGMRFRADVDLNTRIVFNTQELIVRGIQNVNTDDVELRLLCEEVVA